MILSAPGGLDGGRPPGAARTRRLAFSKAAGGIVITYPDSVRFLYALGNEIKTAKLGLDRIRAVLDALGNPQRAFQSVHAAGTNGKGSTCAMIESALRASGMRTGLYTSPHLVEPTERIQVSGRPVSPAEFARAFDRVHSVSTRLLDRGVIGLHPTYFETVTAMGFWLFAEAGVETAVVEVGLGGRLDATNVLEPVLCVITPVDYDHEAWLGSSLASIAGEKAGILKPGVPAVVSPQRPEARVAIEQQAASAGVEVEWVADWRAEGVDCRANGSSFTAVSGAWQADVDCPLPGEHQVVNALAAVAALRRLGMPAPVISKGIAAARWPGRLEKAADAPEIILDGAHNPAGIRCLTRYIRQFYSNRRVWVIYGAMRDKHVEEIGELLASVAHTIVLTQVNSARALRAAVLRDVVDHPRVSVSESLPAALSHVLKQASPEDVVFVTGSLMLVGEARSLFPRQ